MLERNDACLELREVREAFGRGETVRPFHLENIFSGGCVESCDESRDAIAAFKQPNHVLYIGATAMRGQTVGELIGRRHRKARRPIVLTHGLAALRDRPGLAAGGAADIYNSAAKRVSLRGHGVTTRTRKKPTRLARVQGALIHDSSTMP